MLTPSKTRMTAAEFFQLPETTQPTELVDGELIVSPSPVPKHQRCSISLIILLNELIPNGELFDAPMDVYFDDDNVPQPDIMWVAEGSRCKITDKRLEGPPDLIVEIFSPGTARRDRDEKFNLYEKYGVREYWMVDPHEEYVEVYRWENGHYVRQGVFTESKNFVSAVLSSKTVDLSRVFGKKG